MGRFDSGNDTLHAGELVTTIDSLVVVNAQHLCATLLVHVAMHRTNAWIVETSRNSKCLLNLSVVILHHQHLGTVQDTYRTLVHGSCCVVGFVACATSLGQYYFHTIVVHIVIDGACCVRSTTDAGNEVVGIIATNLFFKLPFYFLRNHTLHTCHQVGIRMRSHGRANDIERVAGMAAPVADGCATSIAQCHVTSTNRVHLGTQHLHSFNVGVLALHIGSTHKHLAFHVHQRTYGSCCHTMLSGSSLADDTRLTHLLGQQNLSDGVVNLVRTSVVQVFTLQVQLAAILLAQALGIVQRTGATHVVLQQGMILGLKLLALDDWEISLLQIMHALVEYLRHVSTTKLSIETVFVNLKIAHISFFLLYLLYKI